MSDQWQWWRDALAGKAPAIDANEPKCGFFRKRDGKGGKWLPVMIRTDDTGALRCRVADDSGVDPHDVWTYCAGNPVSKEAAKVAFETGEWPGDAPLIGDNSGDLSLAEQIRDYASQALAWLRKAGIKTKVDSDKAANYRAELIRLAKEADTAREAEKRPLLEASRAVDAKFKPLVDEAKAAADAIRDELTKWMRAEEARLEAERRAKWEAEQKAVAIARAEVEAQRAKQMRDDPIAALTSPDPELPMAPPPPEPVKVNAGGQRGRAAGLRTVKRYEITDYAAALAHVSDHPEVRAAVEKVCAAQAKAGATVPGVKVVEERVAA